MAFLHPYFTIITIALIAFSFREVYGGDYKNYKGVWVVVIAMIFFIGARDWVGVDYGAYVDIFYYWGARLEYGDVLDKMLMQESNLDIEWFYIVIGDIFHDFFLPFQYFTLFLAIFSLGLKYISFEQSSVYPALSMLLYMFPSYFTGDGGQMRQGFAMGILMFSFVFIKQRKLLLFLLMVFLAIGFHKSSAIFILAYWFAIIPFTRNQLLALVLICVILSPFKVYNHISILESLAPAEIYSGFTDFAEIEGGSATTIKFPDLMCVLYMFLIYTYDKEACQRIPYYEYLRNISVAGICIYFIFRESPIFSSRLTYIYLIFTTMAIPNILAALDMDRRRILHFAVIIFVVFYYFVYASMQAPRAGYSIERYNNYFL